MAKKAAASSPAVQEVTQRDTEDIVILQLDPNKVLADDNTRYGLKDSRIQTLADSIVAQGGVIEPVEVEPIDPTPEGYEYRLTLGYYRHAAVKFLNTTMAAGLTLPCIVHVTASPTDRLKRQLAENIERENQSPMDTAVSIQKLMDAGVPKVEIRQMFARPGGRKGAKVQPASNSFINMMLSFLELPKSVQGKIHDGIVTVGAAYQLTKVDKERQAEILAGAEEQRRKDLEREEKEEEKFLLTEKKALESKEKVETAKADLQKAEAKNKQSAQALEKQTALTVELFEASKKKQPTPKDKKAAANAFKEAEKQRLVAEADATEAQKSYEKAQVAYSKLTDGQQSKVKKVAEEQAKKAKVGPSDVRKAAEQAGVAQGAVALNATEIRKVVADMMLPTGNKADAKVIAIGKALHDCFYGITTDAGLFREVRRIVN